MATYNSDGYSPHVLKRTTGAHAPASPQADYGKYRYKHTLITIGVNPDTGAAYVPGATDTYDLFEIPHSRIISMRVGWSSTKEIAASGGQLTIRNKAYTRVNLDGSQTAVPSSNYFTNLNTNAGSLAAPHEYVNMDTGTFEVHHSTTPVVFEAVVSGQALQLPSSTYAGKWWCDITYVVE